MNLGNLITRKKDTIIWKKQKLMLIEIAVTWSISAKMLDIEAESLAVALIIPKKVGVRMGGLKTTISMKVMLKTAAKPNLLSMMLIMMSLGELSYQTNSRAMEPIAANVLIKI